MKRNYLLLTALLLLILSMLPLHYVNAQRAGSNTEELFDETNMEWYSLEEAQKLAEKNNKNILIFGYANWCTYCRKMLKEVYPDSALHDTLSTYYYPVRLNGESDNIVTYQGKEFTEMELARYLRLNSYPTHYFLDSDGSIIFGQQGYWPIEIFQPMVRFVGADHFRNMNFQEFLEANNITITEGEN